MKKLKVGLLVATLSLSACVSEVRETTKLSLKANEKVQQITIVTKTADNAIDPGGLFKQQYYRAMLNQLELDIKATGIVIDEIQFKADEASLDPTAEEVRLLQKKNVRNVLLIDIFNLSRDKYSVSYNLGVSVLDFKSSKQFYDGNQSVAHTIDFSTHEKMRELGDKVFTSIKPALGIE